MDQSVPEGRRVGDSAQRSVDISLEEKRLECPQMSDACDVHGRERRGYGERRGDEQLEERVEYRTAERARL